jgi:short-subunit dehydrogenase
MRRASTAEPSFPAELDVRLNDQQRQQGDFYHWEFLRVGSSYCETVCIEGLESHPSMRDPKKEKELGNIAGAPLTALDVTDPREIESVAEQVMASGGVDVVFNNAGYGLAGPRAGLFINTTSIGGLLMVPFNSIYHATKWAMEGWGESMAFELNQFGIGIKTVEPGGMKTDFFTRSFDTGRHPPYDALVNKVMGIITDREQMATYSSPEQIAEKSTKLPRTEKTNSAILLAQMQKRCMQCARSLGKKRSARRWLSSFSGDAPKAA